MEAFKRIAESTAKHATEKAERAGRRILDAAVRELDELTASAQRLADEASIKLSRKGIPATRAGMLPDKPPPPLLYSSQWQRLKFAGNAGTAPDILRYLAIDADPAVRQAVAGNSSTPPDVLLRLARSRDANLRLMVAGNRSTPVEALEKLAGDNDPLVREEVEKNPHTPREAILRYKRVALDGYLFEIVLPAKRGQHGKLRPILKPGEW